MARQRPSRKLLRLSSAMYAPLTIGRRRLNPPPLKENARTDGNPERAKSCEKSDANFYQPDNTDAS